MNKRNLDNLLKAFLIVFSTIGAAFLNFLLQTMYARNLSLADYGKLSLYLNFIMLVMPVVGAGLHNFWIKCSAKNGNNFYLWLTPSFNFLKLTYLISLVIQAVFCIFYVEEEFLVYILLSTFIIAQVSIDLINSLNIINNNTGKYVFWRCFSPVIRLVLFLMLIYSNKVDLINIGLIYLLSSILPSMFLYKKMKSINPNCNVDKYSILDVFRNCWMYSASGILYLIYLQSNSLFIAYFYNIEEVAVFNIPIILITVILMFPTIIFQKVFALDLNKMFYSNKDQFKKILKKSSLAMFFMGVVAAILFYKLTPIVIDIFFGEKYKDSLKYIEIFSFLIPFAFLSTSLSAAHIRKKDLYSKVLIMFFVAILHVILVFILRNYYDIKVFAYITVFSYFLISILFFFSAKRIIRRAV